MPSLQVRDLPENIYEKLAEQAQKEHRSLAQQAVVLLAKGLNVDLNTKEKRKQLIDRIVKDSEETSKYTLSNPADILKKDRKR